MKKLLVYLIVLFSIFFINVSGVFALSQIPTSSTSNIKIPYNDFINFREHSFEENISVLTNNCASVQNGEAITSYTNAYNKAQELKDNYDYYAIIPYTENTSSTGANSVNSLCPRSWQVYFYNSSDLLDNNKNFYFNSLLRTYYDYKYFYFNLNIYFNNNTNINTFKCTNINCVNNQVINGIVNNEDNTIYTNIMYNSYNEKLPMLFDTPGYYMYSYYNAYPQLNSVGNLYFDIPSDSKIIVSSIPWNWQKTGLSTASNDTWKYINTFTYNGDVNITSGYTLWENPGPSIEYNVEINENEYMDTGDTLYNITLNYKNMSDKYYSIYYNLKDGTKTPINFDNNNYQYVIENVNDDAIITVYIYDLENNMVTSVTIDLYDLDYDVNNKPYIYLTGYNQNNIPNSVAYKYVNTNDNDYTCYYKFGGGELTQESCATDEIKMRYAVYNTSLSLMIYDNDNKLVYTKNLNLNFISGYPKISFESYYNSMSKAQILNIMLSDYDKNDKFYYSLNNIDWNTLPTQDNNTLNFSEDCVVYFKVIRNGEPIADSLYKVIIGNYSVSISENNTLEEIKEMTGSSTSYIKTFFKSIKKILELISDLVKDLYNHLNSETKAFLVAVFSLGLICSIVLLARGRK